MRDNENNMSDVAYEVAPKERNTKRGMPKSKQFEGNKMPQGSKSVTKKEVKKMIGESEKRDRKADKKLMEHHNKTMHHKGRHKEHR